MIQGNLQDWSNELFSHWNINTFERSVSIQYCRLPDCVLSMYQSITPALDIVQTRKYDANANKTLSGFAPKTVCLPPHRWGDIKCPFMVFFLNNPYIFVWIQHKCLANMVIPSVTVNSFYTYTQYNDKIHYNGNFTHETFVQKVTINQILCKNNAFNNSRNIWFGYLLELPQWGNSNKYPNHKLCSVKKYK